ncbi:helix-turn-helix domain-containing protein [Escherichia sp. SP-MK]
MVAPIPAKRGRKPAVATAPATGQVQSLTRGLKLLEWIAESNGSVALTELAQQAGLPNVPVRRPDARNPAVASWLAGGGSWNWVTRLVAPAL